MARYHVWEGWRLDDSIAEKRVTLNAEIEADTPRDAIRQAAPEAGDWRPDIDADGGLWMWDEAGDDSALCHAIVAEEIRP